MDEIETNVNNTIDLPSIQHKLVNPIKNNKQDTHITENTTNINENTTNDKHGTARKYTSIINDQPLGEDYLNYTDYAKAFGSLVSDDKISLPITVGIYAKWGAGKSFLLGKIKDYIKYNINGKLKHRQNKQQELIKKESEQTKKYNERSLNERSLNERSLSEHKYDINLNKTYNEYIIIDFNAWSYSFSDVLWAGLVKEIHSKVEDRYGFIALRLYRFFVYPFRSNSRQKNVCIILYTFFRVLFLIVFSVIIGLISYEEILLDLVGDIAVYSVFGITLATIIPSIIELLVTMCKDHGTEIMKGAKNIDDKVGFMGDVRNELDLICDFVKMKKAKFAVFIDDLDRCSPDKTVAMLDATMLLLSNLNYPFLTFIAIDPRLIVKSIEITYENAFKQNGITGFEYLDKLIQIPFNIPIASPKTKDSIVRILTREKEDVLNIVFDLYVFLASKHVCDMNIKIGKKLVQQFEHTKLLKLTYTDKIKVIQHIYECIKENYGIILDAIYIYDITDTSSILAFLLRIFRHLKDIYIERITEYETQVIRKTVKRLRNIDGPLRTNSFSSNISSKNRTISKEIVSNMNITEILGAFLSRDIRGDIRVGELKEIIIDETPTVGTLPPQIKSIYLKIENGCATDRNFLDFGQYLQERKNRERHYTMIEGLNEEICKYYEHLRKFMNTNMIKYSPLNNELSSLYLNMEKIVRTIQSSINTLYAHSQSMLSIEEIKYFHSISHFFDGNCRRNKKIINIYVIIKNMLTDRIAGWYHSKPITTYVLKILIKLVILFEQWPFRMSCIFHMMENYKERLELLPDDSDGLKFNLHTDELIEQNNIETIEQWFELHHLSTLYSVFEHFPKKLFSHDELKSHACIDYNSILFRKFLVEQQPIITIEYFYVCIGYIFNINYTIKDKIEMVSNYGEMFMNSTHNSATSSSPDNIYVKKRS